jgi:hypothetical protein
MATYLTSNIFSDIYVGGNCVVKGTMTVSGGGGTTQWTTTGLNIYYNTGNVGIGTNAPEVKLDITDSSLVIAPTTFTGAANYGVFFRHGFATSSFYNCSILAYDHNTDNNPDGISINGYDGVSICTGSNTRQERLRVTQAGNVGILTAAPGYPLHVVGDINFTGSLRQNGTVYAPSSQWTGTGGNPIYYVPFVGIGSTLTPTASLMVTGNVFASNAIQTTNIVSAGFTSNATATTFACDTMSVPFVNATQITAASSVGIGTTLPVQALDVYGSMNVATVSSSTGLMFRNRIINGDFKIDQRNNGASFTPTAAAVKTYTLDRWWGWCQIGSKFSVQRSTEVPVGQGFTNSMLVTSLSAYSTPVGGYYGFGQFIEGYNIADMGFGTASATMVTLSFWARSSLTGTFSVALENGSFNRSYIFNYTISSVNTWQYFTLPLRADTTGTWDNTTGQGLRLWWDLGSNDTTYAGAAGSWLAADKLRTTGSVSLIGTNAATLYIAGAQVEKGSVATLFEFRPFATELALCQRYYTQWGPTTGSQRFGLGVNNGTISYLILNYLATMRIPPTAISVSSPSHFNILGGAAPTSITIDNTSITIGSVALNFASSVGSGATLVYGASALAYIGLASEL